MELNGNWPQNNITLITSLVKIKVYTPNADVHVDMCPTKVNHILCWYHGTDDSSAWSLQRNLYNNES